MVLKSPNALGTLEAGKKKKKKNSSAFCLCYKEEQKDVAICTPGREPSLKSHSYWQPDIKLWTSRTIENRGHCISHSISSIHCNTPRWRRREALWLSMAFHFDPDPCSFSQNTLSHILQMIMWKKSGYLEVMVLKTAYAGNPVTQKRAWDMPHLFESPDFEPKSQTCG